MGAWEGRMGGKEHRSGAREGRMGGKECGGVFSISPSPSLSIACSPTRSFFDGSSSLDRLHFARSFADVLVPRLLVFAGPGFSPGVFSFADVLVTR